MELPDPLNNNPTIHPKQPPLQKSTLPINLEEAIKEEPRTNPVPSLIGRAYKEFSSLSYKVYDRITTRALQQLGICAQSISHQKLVDLLVALYPEKASTKGICFGFALMGMPAVFLRDVDHFNDRLTQLRDLVSLACKQKKPYNQFIEELEKTKYCDLLPFLEGVQVCMNGAKYPELVDPEVGLIDSQQNKNFVKTFLSLVASKELEEKGEVVQINQVRSGIYTQDSLISYFKNLRKTLKAPPPFTEPINILFTSIRAPHAITVGYDPKEDLYLFIDSNHGHITKVKNDKEIADAVINGYSDSLLSDGSVALSHTIYAINSYEKEKKEIEALLENNNINLAVLKIQELPSSKDQLNSFLKIIPLDHGSSWDSFIQKESISRCKSMKATGSLMMKKEQDSFIKKQLQVILDSLETRIINGENSDQQKEYKSSGMKSLEEKESLLETNLTQTVQNFSSEQQKDWLLLASESNDLSSVQKLVAATVDLDIQNSDGLSPLLIASRMQNTEIALSLIQGGAPLNIQDLKGNTPLHMSIISNHTEIALALIQAGAHLDVKNSKGNTPLHIAIGLGRTKIALALIQALANPNIKNSKGETLLHMAIAISPPEIALALIQAGAHLNIQDLNGDTPLHLAICNVSPEIALALMNQPDIDLDIKNLEDLTPRDFAEIYNLSEIVDAIDIHNLITKKEKEYESAFLKFEENQKPFNDAIDFLFEKHSTGSLLYNLSLDHKKKLMDSLQGLSLTQKEEKLKSFIDSLAPSKEQIALNLTNSIKFQTLLKTKTALQDLSDQLLTAMKDKSTSPEKQLDLVTVRNKAAKAFVEEFNSFIGSDVLSVTDLELSNPALLESNIKKAMNILIDSGFRI